MLPLQRLFATRLICRSFMKRVFPSGNLWKLPFPARFNRVVESYSSYDPTTLFKRGSPFIGWAPSTVEGSYAPTNSSTIYASETTPFFAS